MQLVLHAPFGSRINRAWALALRKRFCRQFNFELQAAATEDALLLSLGEQHSFPLADVFRYLHPATVRDILVQAFLDAPVFQTRWRWNATISLAVPRNRGGRKVAPQLQRMQADDLMAAVFPDAAACLENIPGRPRDSRSSAGQRRPCATASKRRWICPGWSRSSRASTPASCSSSRATRRSRRRSPTTSSTRGRTRFSTTRRSRSAGRMRCRPAAPPAHRTRAASSTREAIARVRDEQRPDARDADELHDVLLSSGFLAVGEADDTLFGELAAARRATRFTVSGHTLLVAAERLPELRAIHPHGAHDDNVVAPPARAAVAWTADHALVEVLRGRLEVVGPTTAAALAASAGIGDAAADAALLALEADGAVLRGVFTPGSRALEWCNRRLLARIHRYTLHRLRAEISPVSPAQFMRFLFAWQHADRASALSGPDGLRAVIAQLDGLELPARAWEHDVLPARLDHYEGAMLDMLCLTGEVGWARLSSGPTQVVGATPVTLCLREHADAWHTLRSARTAVHAAAVSPAATLILDRLRARGASFAAELAATCALDADALRAAIAELVAAGLVTSDGFAGLRSIIGGLPGSAPSRLSRTDSAGRWSTPICDGNGNAQCAVGNDLEQREAAVQAARVDAVTAVWCGLPPRARARDRRRAVA